MSKIADAEANATSLDGLVNDNGLITTLRNGPKPSWQYIVDQVYAQLGYAVVGSFVDGFTYTGIRQVGVDASGNTWIYTGGDQNLPHVVPAGTVPSAPDYFQVSVNSADNVVLDNGENLQQAIDRLNVEVSDVDGYIDNLESENSSATLSGRAASDYQKSLNISENSGSMVDRLIDISHPSKTYLKKVNEGGIDYLTFGGSVNGKAFDYTLRLDDDNMLLLRGGRVGEQVPASSPVVATNVTGGFLLSATNPTGSYARQIGDYFDLDFEGTGLIFNHYSDNRGGLWGFSIDGGANIEISVYSATGQFNNAPIVVEGLENGPHTCRATYLGADPENPPSTGDNGRGWFNYTTEGDIETGSALVANPFSILKRSDASAVISPISIPEFAINITPTGSSTGRWIPQHGEYSGACRNVTRTIIKDGEFIGSDISLISGTPELCESLIINHTYTAYPPEDVAGDYPLWNGSITHKFTGLECMVTHKLEYIGDQFSAAGYYGMFPSDSRVCDKLVTSNGESVSVSDVSRITNLTPCSSFAFFGSGNGFASAYEAKTLYSTLRFNDNNLFNDSCFVEERTDNVSKVYLKGFNQQNTPIGTTERYQSRYAISANVSVESI